MPNRLRKSDAKNRSLRTFLQGLGFAVLAAAVMVVYPVVSSAHSWGDLHWSLLAFSLTQAVVTAGLAYLMRAVLDPSKIPTPLPPADPGPPEEPVAGERGAIDLVTVLVVVALVLLILVLVGYLR